MNDYYDILGSSPPSVTAFLDNNFVTTTASKKTSRGIKQDEKTEQQRVSMKEFLKLLPMAIEERKEYSIPAGSEQDPVMNLFRHLDHREEVLEEWMKYAYFDKEKCYTRNLIATDHETYTVLLLCWNPNRFSPIHDHPSDGCWMKVLQGQVQETRYKYYDDDHNVDSHHNDNKLVCTQDTVLSPDDGLVFIEDSLGYHKVGNPNPIKPAITLHVYSPPFQTCKIWLNENRPPTQSCICHYSEYGKKV